jgi:hypothetical protein
VITRGGRSLRGSAAIAGATMAIRTGLRSGEWTTRGDCGVRRSWRGDFLRQRGRPCSCPQGGPLLTEWAPITLRSSGQPSQGAEPEHGSSHLQWAWCRSRSYLPEAALVPPCWSARGPSGAATAGGRQGSVTPPPGLTRVLLEKDICVHCSWPAFRMVTHTLLMPSIAAPE